LIRNPPAGDTVAQHIPSEVAWSFTTSAKMQWFLPAKVDLDLKE